MNFLKELEENIQLLQITSGVWNLACELAQKCRVQGTPIPTTDMVIAACARHHKVGLEHTDKHFNAIAGL